ncbi:MAG: DUF1059 domain-containing protein [Archaeoglobaceae archaeon]
MYNVFCRRCGYEAVGNSESELIEKMQKHISDVHNEETLSERALEDIREAIKT